MEAEHSASYEEMQMLIKSIDKRPESEYREYILDACSFVAIKIKTVYFCKLCVCPVILIIIYN